jgi:hypothetical protein
MHGVHRDVARQVRRPTRPGTRSGDTRRMERVTAAGKWSRPVGAPRRAIGLFTVRTRLSWSELGLVSSPGGSAGFGDGGVHQRGCDLAGGFSCAGIVIHPRRDAGPVIEQRHGRVRWPAFGCSVRGDQSGARFDDAQPDRRVQPARSARERSRGWPHLHAWTWVLITESSEGGGDIQAHAHTNADLAALAHAARAPG